MNQTDTDGIQVTRDLLIRYDKPGPRYTSYPTAPEWKEEQNERGCQL